MFLVPQTVDAKTYLHTHTQLSLLQWRKESTQEYTASKKKHTALALIDATFTDLLRGDQDADAVS